MITKRECNIFMLGHLWNTGSGKDAGEVLKAFDLMGLLDDTVAFGQAVFGKSEKEIRDHLKSKGVNV